MVVYVSVPSYVLNIVVISFTSVAYQQHLEGLLFSIGSRLMLYDIISGRHLFMHFQVGVNSYV